MPPLFMKIDTADAAGRRPADADRRSIATSGSRRSTPTPATRSTFEPLCEDGAYPRVDADDVRAAPGRRAGLDRPVRRPAWRATWTNRRPVGRVRIPGARRGRRPSADHAGEGRHLHPGGAELRRREVDVLAEFDVTLPIVGKPTTVVRADGVPASDGRRRRPRDDAAAKDADEAGRRMTAEPTPIRPTCPNRWT